MSHALWLFILSIHVFIPQIRDQILFIITYTMTIILIIIWGGGKAYKREKNWPQIDEFKICYRLILFVDVHMLVLSLTNCLGYNHMIPQFTDFMTQQLDLMEDMS